MQPWQTRASEFHPFLVASIDELPDNLCPLVEAALPPGSVMASGLVVPANYRSKTAESALEPAPAQALIFTGDGMWHVQAPQADEPAPAPLYIKPEAIRWIRSSHLLLYGRLEIASADHGQPVLLDIEFNAVGWRQKDQNWRNLVAQAVGMPLIRDGAPPAPGEHDRVLLRSAPEKFMDGIFTYGLYTGETLVDATFRPAVWRHHLVAFDEQLAPATLVALTNASVLILAEEKTLVLKSDEFGLIITRIPRQAISDVQVEAGDEIDTALFSLDRDGVADVFRLPLAHDAAQTWLAIWGGRQ